jgi:hypothetical protein
MNKITVKLIEDEWYPVIDISEYGEVTVEISQELFEKYNKIMQEFNDLQNELHKLYKKINY